MNRAVLPVIAGSIIIFSATLALFLFARGWRLDLTKKELAVTGILVATSDPDGAEVYLDGKLRTATNNTINLPPGNYRVRIEKPGFSPWEKLVTIKKEEVIKTNAFLFPTLPDLHPLTFNGAAGAVLSPDENKIAFMTPPSTPSATRSSDSGLWVLDMGRFSLPAPISLGADLRQISRRSDWEEYSWSATGREVIATESGGLIFLLQADQLNTTPPEVSLRLPVLLAEQRTMEARQATARQEKIPKIAAPALASAAGELVFSPDESKILYLATASASLPTVLSAYLPGTNPTPENRLLEPGKTYVYDLKEDRNYLIPGDWVTARPPVNRPTVNPPTTSYEPPATSRLSWFPSSRHLLSVTDKEIALLEFDGANRAVIFSGPFAPEAVFSWPNGSRIVILTPLNSPDSTPNLYSVNLR